MKISSIMRKAYVIENNVSVKEAAKIMSSKKIGELIVVNDNKIKGIITEMDIINNIKNLESPVSSIMTKKIISVSPDDDSKTAASLMSEYKIKRLPVINNGKLVGLIRITDIIGKTDATDEGDFFFD